MKFMYIACLFTLIIACAYSMAVEVTGIQCTAHIVVKPGDNCLNYIHNNNVEMTLESLLYLNPLLDCNNLQVNDKVCIEGVDLSDDPAEATYIVQSQDTCEIIAEKLNLTVRILKNYSFGELDCNQLRVGQRITYRIDGDYTPEFVNSKEIDVEYY
ncbi:hypothetical protein PIROE2DRAFT_12505 [Piromyces sp. E2]|nr:hypothetical protein PIROE2DRAFT_12505 [Piromyces sp. E2]|eukprot:OUM61503.1 hypothetical protein PIROE2DRAFT_12505 [Piromyces sp. E2]